MSHFDAIMEKLKILHSNGYVTRRAELLSCDSPAILSVKTMILTIGLSWIIFNLFIGLIFAGALVELLLRGGLDRDVTAAGYV